LAIAANSLITAWLEVRVLPGPPRILTQTEISRFIAKCPDLAGIRARILSLRIVDWITGAVRRLCLCPAKSRFPTAETGDGGDSVRILGQCERRWSNSCCRDHSAGKSVRRATPMPCGSRPSMAALTRLGARKASEIVMFTLRMLQSSRFAMLSVVTDGSVVSSSSQRRPRAIEAISVARFSERIGRSFRNSVPSGKITSRRRVEFAFCHGT